MAPCILIADALASSFWSDLMRRFFVTLGNVVFVALSPVTCPFLVVATLVKYRGRGFTTDSAWTAYSERLCE